MGLRCHPCACATTTSSLQGPRTQVRGPHTRGPSPRLETFVSASLRQLRWVPGDKPLGSAEPLPVSSALGDSVSCLPKWYDFGPFLT